MGALRKEELYTTDYIESLPEGERAELIGGEIVFMSPPRTSHQRLLMELSYRIKQYISSKGGDCEVLPAPFGVYINNDIYNYVEPDISVICDRSKIDEKGCMGAPDWVIEIVSKSSRRMDYFVKLFKYQNAGVREYWIADPEKNRITVYFFDNPEQGGEYTFGDKVRANIYEDLEIDFSEIKIEI